ncbi:putative E3 ubiquitin-protein ligase ARI2 [Iris pallida]|nr:putative E3 ubiquitin-protein ligase ARI2 [Iris pallida]
MDLFALTEHHARTLLIYYQWDVERISESLELKGREQLFLEAGVSIICKKDETLSASSGLITCNICFDEVSDSAVTVMSCGHYYCSDCWIEHFIIRINEGQSRRIRCMAPKCNFICDEAIVRSLVSRKHPDIAERFERFLLESYIEDNKKVKWCPSKPHCGNAIRVEGDKCCEVECICGLQFCFSCLSEAHSPCSCLMWELWFKKVSGDLDNIGWVATNTKPCPKCHKAVEKNGGCNLVFCICGQPFCWLCGGATGRDHTWRTITGHSCGRFGNNNDKTAAWSKRKHLRYVHYCSRYKAHTDSFKKEVALSSQKNTLYLSQANEFKEYSSWVLNGLNRLLRSRRILSYSYAFAFYMFGDDLFKNEMTPLEREIKQNLFEDQQQQLESNLEKLSMFLQKDLQLFSDEQIEEIRMHVINLSRVVDLSCKKMYQCIENELLQTLQSGFSHQIAPYKSSGLERAS